MRSRTRSYVQAVIGLAQVWMGLSPSSAALNPLL